jgi:thiol-disulfide isomerase/thioredoxin
MRPYKIIFIVLLVNTFSFGQVNFELTGNIFNAEADSVSLSHNVSGTYVDLYKVPLTEKGDFSIKGSVPNQDYYVFRISGSNVHLIIRNDSKIQIYGDGKNIFNFCNIVGSNESDQMNQFVKLLTLWNVKRDSAIYQIQQNPSKQEEISNAITTEYYTFQSNVQSFVAKNQNSAALIPVLSALDTKNDFASYESVVKQLLIGFPESPTVQLVYNNYLQIIAQREAENILAPGKEAPDFEELMLDRETKLKLSDLRGNVVLLDFWASWCGPCRKENPNVVKLYNKYKDSGFTVMSVSLDKDLTLWKAAIENDGLIWPNHVSDLQQWSSKVGQLYQVKGIPFTVLIDKEGKIIKTNLRGETLESELKSIFEADTTEKEPEIKEPEPEMTEKERKKAKRKKEKEEKKKRTEG